MVFIHEGIFYNRLTMNNKPRVETLFDRPAVYTICVQGRIDPSWSDRLEGMAIRPISNEGESLITTLEGEIIDQSALAGVLNTLYELHLPVISMERLTS